MSVVLLVHAGVTCFMAGLIWTCQLVHYPLFALVGRQGYAPYQAEHMRRITWIVGPVMVAEALLAVIISLRWSDRATLWLPWLALVILVGIWASTATLQGPAHGRLARGFDEQLFRRLVGTNWLRTAAWSIRAALALMMVAAQGGASS